MRRFVSARPRSSAAMAAKAEHSSLPSCDTTAEDASAWITPDDGDLWQPLPESATQIAEPIMPIPLAPGMPPEDQTELRWHQFLQAHGFIRMDHDAPFGFEDFTWDKVFPPDREALAQALEPLVARGDDLQAAIDDMNMKIM